MENERERPGSAFGWNAGGWFGAQVGASCWILLAAGMAWPVDAGTAAALGAVFLGANLAGLGLWGARRRLAAYPAMQALIAVLWAASVVAVLVLKAGPAAGAAVGEVPWTLLVLLYPGLMLMVWLKERAARLG